MIRAARRQIRLFVESRPQKAHCDSPSVVSQQSSSRRWTPETRVSPEQARCAVAVDHLPPVAAWVFKYCHGERTDFGNGRPARNHFTG